jgi:hypothetical protein
LAPSVVETRDMDDRLKSWRPTPQEIDKIRMEMRPLIRDLARRDQDAIAKEIFLRRLRRIG